MQDCLSLKLAMDNCVYTDEEINWCLENIGDVNPDIRDGLVYLSFCKMIDEERLTVDQFKAIGQWCQSEQSIYSKLPEMGVPTLKRSFTALLQTLLLWADDRDGSAFQGKLSRAVREYFFKTALEYLRLETDDTALHPDFGWVHAFAHGADLLAVAACHSQFPSIQMNKLLEVLGDIFLTRQRRFVGDEEGRLAAVIIRTILQGKLSVQGLIDWLKKGNFSNEFIDDWDRQQSFRLFLLPIYVELDHANLLEASDKDVLYALI
ncbi:DUF2785 domain-containing protein [Streptococcus rifensis]